MADISLEQSRFERIVAEWSSNGRVSQRSQSKDNDLGRRLEPRKTWFAAVELVPKSSEGSWNRLYATSTDISNGGVGILSRNQLERGQSVWMRVPDERGQGAWVPMRVSHSTQTVGGYRVGLSFESEKAK